MLSAEQHSPSVARLNSDPFIFNSDCRGESIFLPKVPGASIPQPQIPVTLPAYDEVIGLHSISREVYNDYLLGLLDPDGLNVLTLHAEVEGIACLEMFHRFLEKALSRGAAFAPLGTLLSHYPQPGVSAMIQKKIAGREGWLSFQEGGQVRGKVLSR